MGAGASGWAVGGGGQAPEQQAVDEDDYDVGEWIEDSKGESKQGNDDNDNVNGKEDSKGGGGGALDGDEDEGRAVLCMGASGKDDSWVTWFVSGAFLLPSSKTNGGDDHHDDDEAEMVMQDLHSLSERGDATAVRRLLQQNAADRDLVHRPRDGRPGADTALLCAARAGHADCVNVLIGAGARVEYVNDEQENATLLAARYGHLAALECLLDNNAPVEDRALLLAVEGGHSEVVDHLTSLHYCDVEVMSPKLMTPLLLAVKQGPHALDITRTLCEAGADVNVHGPNGYTPVMVAAERNDRETAALLVEFGADLSATNALGYTAMDVASLCNHLSLFEDLYAAHRRRNKKKQKQTTN